MSGYNAKEVVKSVTAGQTEYVYEHGRQVKISRNVTGALFFTVGPIHGMEATDEAAAMIEAIRSVHRNFYGQEDN